MWSFSTWVFFSFYWIPGNWCLGSYFFYHIQSVWWFYLKIFLIHGFLMLFQDIKFSSPLGANQFWFFVCRDNKEIICSLIWPMERHLDRQDSDIEFQRHLPGCIWNMFHILDYHHWHSVKKMSPRRKQRRGKHATCKHLCYVGWVLNLQSSI